MTNVLKNLWFRDTKEDKIYINEVAVRMRAGILILITLFMGLTFYDVVFTNKWIVDTNTIHDTFETNFDDQIIYAAEITKRTYSYVFQTKVLFYVLFEMITSMFVFGARLSPTILIASFLSRNTPPLWKPLAPKRFAWTIGATMVTLCIIFFNPDTFAQIINNITGIEELIPTTYNFMPLYTGLTLVVTCLLFMWLELTFGFCAGCYVHALLVKIGIIKEECLDCNDIFARAKRIKEEKEKNSH